VDWQVIVTLIIAIITAFVAYLNYRTRPLLVRTKEKHSEDLKRVLENWLAQLVSEGSIIASLIPAEIPCHLNLSIEQDPLFPDLREHMPEGVDLVSQWQNLKTACVPYDTGRGRLYDRIYDDVCKIRQGLSVDEFFARNFTEVIYEEASHLAEGDTARSLDGRLKTEQYVEQTPSGPKTRFEYFMGSWRLVSGHNEQQVNRVATYLPTALENMSHPGTTEARYVEEARRLKVIRDTLIEDSEELIQSIKDVLAIPILTGNCRYIKQATESFFPFNVKHVFRIGSRSVGKQPK
jgi:hypothetical protein